MSTQDEDDSSIPPSYMFGTQAQATIDSWNEIEKQKKALAKIGAKFKFKGDGSKKTYKITKAGISKDGNMKRRRKAPRKNAKKTRKIGSITAKMSRKYSDIKSIGDLSGKRGKLRRFTSTGSGGTLSGGLDESLYDAEDWQKVLTRIQDSIPQTNKSRKESLGSFSEEYKSRKGEDSKLWTKSSIPPETMTKEDLKALYDYNSDNNEKSFVSDEPALPESIMTLSQVMSGIDRRIKKEEDIVTISDSCSESATPIDVAIQRPALGTQHAPEPIPSSEPDTSDLQILSSSPKLAPVAKPVVADKVLTRSSTSMSALVATKGKSIDQLPENMEMLSQVSNSTSVVDSDDLICLGETKDNNDEPVNPISSSNSVQIESVKVEPNSPNTSSIQVPSSQKGHESEGEDKDTADSEPEFLTAKESIKPEANPILKISEEEIPDSQSDNIAAIEVKQSLEVFKKFSTKQLRHQISAWGLKPVRSRKGMLSLLEMSCGMIDTKLLQIALDKYNPIKDEIIRINHAKKPEDDRKIIEREAFTRIRKILLTSNVISEDILVYKPLRVDNVMRFLHKKGLRDLDTGLLCDCLDELGICFTESDDKNM